MSVMAFTFPFTFEQPAWLWLCLLVPALVAGSLWSMTGLDPVRRYAALSVRSLLIILLACCLAGIQKVQRNNDLTVIFLLDRSHSVQELEQYAESYVYEASRDVLPHDRVGLIDFSRNAYLQQLPMQGGYFIPPGRLPIMPNTDRTDIAAAIRLAMAMFPHDTAKRIVLISDGNDNVGDVLTEARRAKADGIPIDVVPLRYERRNEVFFDRLIVPTHAEPGEQVPLRMVLSTTKRVAGRISIYVDGTAIDLPDDRTHVTLQPGENTFFMKLPVRNQGVQTFEARFRPDNAAMDTIALNNTARAFTFISGRSRVLLVSANLENDRPLAEALASEKVDVELKPIDELGEFRLLQMMNYSSIILANIPAASFSDEQQRDLARYVRDMGSGLVMTGGDEAFGAGGWIGSPVEDVMPVTFEIKHKRVIPRGALVLIMHSCEIARGNYWGKEMAKKSVDTISSKDYLGILAYTYSPGGENWEVPLAENRNKPAVKARIDRMQIGDMPDFGRTMQMAYKELTSGVGRDAAQKHVIILSDGDAQAPSASLMRDFKRAKITVSTIAIGWGGHVEQAVLRQIASDTGGRFYAARNPRQLPQIFSKESKVVRRPLIVDEPFQPIVVDAHSELLAGIDVDANSLPPLGGMVLTSPKNNPNVIVPVIRKTKDGDDPVLAYWQCELGKSVVFASGHWPYWGKAWTQWPKFAKLWAQLVRWTMRQEAPANFDTYTKVEGNRGTIVIDALDVDASFLNNLKLETQVIGPDDTSIPVRFTQIGPGKYEAKFEVDKAGFYLANVRVTDRGRKLGTIRTGLPVPFSPEYRDLTPNEPLLRRIAEMTGGRWLESGPRQDNVFSHDLPPTVATRPAWDWVLAWLLLPAFLLDVSVRRLASWLALSIVVEIVVLVVLLYGLEIRYGTWWGIVGAVLLAELIGWTIRFRYIGPLFDFLTHGVTALAHAGERSTASLDQLKTTRDRVREGLKGDDVAREYRTKDAQTPVELKTRRRRFDIGDREAAKPTGDLGSALGGAKAGEKHVEKTRRPAAAGDADAKENEDMTSRLLRAKRKARDNREDQDG